MPRLPLHEIFEQYSSTNVNSLRLARKSQKPIADVKALIYVGQVNENLTCPICYCPFNNPVRLPCDHFFCRDCITEAVASQRQGSQCCPACRSSVGPSSTFAAPRIIQQMLDDLLVRCPSHRNGCRAEVHRSSVQDHIENYCAYTEVECPISFCPHSVYRKDAENGKCLHRTVTCNNCKQPLMGV